MSQPFSHVASVIQTLSTNRNLKSGVKYLAPDRVVKVTRQRKPERRGKSETFLVTIGKPNFLGRRFVAQCKKAGEPFPVRKVQTKEFARAA